MSIRDLPHSWGTTPAELTAGYAGDSYAHPGSQRLLRAVTVEADSATVFRWVCQLRVAPYSYDWIDNRGRRSPRTLTPGADRLEVGQRFVVIARIVDVAPGHHVTAVSRPGAERLFGPLVLTYEVSPEGPSRSRLICCVRVPGGSMLRRVRRCLLGWGDLVMMRKQLLTLKECAEQTHVAEAGASRVTTR